MYFYFRFVWKSQREYVIPSDSFNYLFSKHFCTVWAIIFIKYKKVILTTTTYFPPTKIVEKKCNQNRDLFMLFSFSYIFVTEFLRSCKNVIFFKRRIAIFFNHRTQRIEKKNKGMKRKCRGKMCVGHSLEISEKRLAK